MTYHLKIVEALFGFGYCVMLPYPGALAISTPTPDDPCRTPSHSLEAVNVVNQPNNST